MSTPAARRALVRAVLAANGPLTWTQLVGALAARGHHGDVAVLGALRQVGAAPLAPDCRRWGLPEQMLGRSPVPRRAERTA